MCRVSSSATLCDPWTVAHQVPPAMGFPKQEYWSGLPFPTLGDLPNPGMAPVSLMSPALAGGFFTTEPPGKPTKEDPYSLANQHGHLGWIKSLPFGGKDE